MTIQEVHNTILFYLNKEQNAFISHEEIDLVLDRAQQVLFNQYHTNPRLPAQAQAGLYGESQRIDDSLSPFKVKYDFVTSTSPSGVVTLPTDYMHLISLYTRVYDSSLGRNVYSSVQVLAEDELIQRIESQVIPMTSDDPIAIMNSANKIQLFPNDPADGGVYYFRKPNTPKFNYTSSGRTITFTSTGSVDLEWRDSDISNIVSIALSYLGLNLSSGDIMQFAEAKIQTGQ